MIREQDDGFVSPRPSDPTGTPSRERPEQSTEVSMPLTPSHRLDFNTPAWNSGQGELRGPTAEVLESVRPSEGPSHMPINPTLNQASAEQPDVATDPTRAAQPPMELPVGLQTLFMSMMAAMGTVGPGPRPFSTSPGSYSPAGPRGSSIPLPTTSNDRDDTMPAGAASDGSPERPDPRAFFRQQFAQFAEALRQSPASRSDPERAQELLRGLKDPGQTVLRRLVRICEVEDARGESNEGVQCGICLDTITEIFERMQDAKEACKSDGIKSHMNDETPRERRNMEVDAPLPVAMVTDTPDMQDVELLLDGQRSACNSEDTNFKAFPCHHFFCEECLLPWLSTHTTCPTCRLDIDPHSITLRRPVSRQQRDTSLRPGPTRTSAIRSTRPAAWRMLRVSPSAPPIPVQASTPSSNPDRLSVATTPRHTPASADQASHATPTEHLPVEDTTVESTGPPRLHASRGIEQLRATPDSPVLPRPLIPTHGHHVMDGLTIVFLSGESVPPSDRLSGPPPLTEGESARHHSSSEANPDRPAQPLAGSVVSDIGSGPPPPAHPGHASEQPAGSPLSTNSNPGPQADPQPGSAQPRLPPLILAFGQNMAAGLNPFAAPEDLVYVRSDAAWSPPAPKNSLRQWLHKRERDLNIVCDDPHCRYVRPDVINDFDEELVQLNAFLTYDALCEHRYHASCLRDASCASGNYQPLGDQGSRAALRCLQCRKQGWATMDAAGQRSRSTSIASGQQ